MLGAIGWVEVCVLIRHDVCPQPWKEKVRDTVVSLTPPDRKRSGREKMWWVETYIHLREQLGQQWSSWGIKTFPCKPEQKVWNGSSQEETGML